MQHYIEKYALHANCNANLLLRLTVEFVTENSTVTWTVTLIRISFTVTYNVTIAD